MTTPLWGIDLGGTKIEGVILEDSEKLNVLKRLRLPTEQEQGYEHILHQIKKVVNRMSAETGLRPDRIGIGTPGTIDPGTQTLKNSNTLCLNGQPFKKDLEDLLGLPIETANDANCFALSEALLGIGAEMAPDAEVVWGVIMGTGVGSGVVVNGRVINGRHGIGGEWGHNLLEDNGSPCYCGRAGCVEQVLSGPSLMRYYHGLTGERLTMPQIMERYQAGGDAAAEATVERMLHFFGKAIGPIINVIDPQIIVLGGGLGNIDLLYTAGVERVKEYIFNNRRLETQFLKPKLGDSAGVFGAALLWKN